MACLRRRGRGAAPGCAGRGPRRAGGLDATATAESLATEDLATAGVSGTGGAGGYLASRQLYFIGTNQQGIVTIYRGFPYQLPGGLNLFETYVVSGVPASLVPADHRGAFFNNQLRSQSDALNLVRKLELGQVS